MRKKPKSIYYLHGINSFEDYVYIKKMNNLIEQIVREIEYKGTAYIRIPASIGLFTE